ncbi:MAG: PQQ-binding-like beta-propeller repeat protein [Planctomycetota bacterium]|nr:PQQ-binding-like beta-propeller repeat protein [Planctomycetota bacterium]
MLPRRPSRRSPTALAACLAALAAGLPALAGAVLTLSVHPASAADWPQWRGPDRSGVSPESSGYPAGWPPKRLWARNAGVGCTSPILVGGHLYVMGWHGSDRSPRRPGGHTGGPAPFRVGGVPCLANLALRKLIVLRIDPGHEGQTVAEVPWSTHYANNIPTPAVMDGHVLVTSSYNVSRTVLFEVTPQGLKEKWRVRDHAKVGSPVIYKGRVFLVHNALMRLDLASGRRLWQGGNFGHGSCLVTAGDDRLLVFSRGRLVLLDALAKAYKELAKVDGLFRATCYPHPAIADGLVAVKDMKGNLVCLDTRK